MTPELGAWILKNEPRSAGRHAEAFDVLDALGFCVVRFARPRYLEGRAHWEVLSVEPTEPPTTPGSSIGRQPQREQQGTSGSAQRSGRGSTLSATLTP